MTGMRLWFWATHGPAYVVTMAKLASSTAQACFLMRGGCGMLRCATVGGGSDGVKDRDRSGLYSWTDVVNKVNHAIMAGDPDYFSRRVAQPGRVDRMTSGQ